MAEGFVRLPVESYDDILYEDIEDHIMQKNLQIYSDDINKQSCASLASLFQLFQISTGCYSV